MLDWIIKHDDGNDVDETDAAFMTNDEQRAAVRTNEANQKNNGVTFNEILIHINLMEIVLVERKST